MNLRLRALRTAFQAADLVAPELARRWAQRLFMRPPRFPAPAPERAALRRACPFGFASGGLQLRGWAWGEGPRVLLAHGWGGRGGQMHPLVEPLVDAGYSVLLFDAPAHGRSQGRRLTAPQYARAMQDLAVEAGPFHAVVGHSFGGATLSYALAQGLPAERAVLIAAPEGPEFYYRQLLAALGYAPARHAALVEAFTKDIGIRFEDVRVPGLAPRLRIPALVVHDEEDREVPFSQGQAIAAAWPGAELLPTRGLGHRRILKDPELHAAILAFLAKGGSASAAGGRIKAFTQRSLERELFCPELRSA